MLCVSAMAYYRSEQVIEEGLAKVIVPRFEYYRRPDGRLEPAWMPVFYNPQAVLSRDLTVLFLRVVLGGRDYFFIDSLSGTGVRGIRIALEVGGRGILNDVDPRAYYYINKNIKLNKLAGRLEAFNSEANSLLNNLVVTGVVPDYVDVDPYGSPIPHIDSALKSLGREAYLGVTATDTGPLSCTYPRKTLARYWSKCIKLDFEKEFASRLLISNIALRAAALEISLKPLITLVYKYYVRVFFQARRSAVEAYKTINNCTGYLWYCTNTIERGFTKNPEEVDFKCSDGSKPVVLGRLWTCNIIDPEVASKMQASMGELPWISSLSRGVLEILAQESMINAPYYRLDKLCSILKINMPSTIRVIERLREMGWISSRTHMDPRGVKTSADYGELVEVLKSMSQRHTT